MSFPSHSAARAQGCWSHHLTFHSDCWVLVWRPDGGPPTAIYAEGQQHWDPEACTLRPALNSLPDGWWPSTHGSTSPAEPLHFVEASGDTGCVNVLLWSQRCCRRLDLEDLTQGRDGDVLPDTSVAESHYIASVPRSHLSPPPNRAGRMAQPGPFSLYAVIAWVFASTRRWAAPGGPHWGLCLLACYLAAYGAPPSHSAGTEVWERDMTAPAHLTARLHEYWWRQPLSPHLPAGSPNYACTAWHSFPIWTGGVPNSILIATDGSGDSHGAWAFVAWCHYRNLWYRLGWAAAPLHSTPWVSPDARTGDTRLASFNEELAALESAGLWVSALIDLWYLHTSTRPVQVTIAVDNASALQIAAGHGRTSTPLAQLTRQAWQSVQARVNTCFRHVHSHTGLLANSLADIRVFFSLKRGTTVNPAVRLRGVFESCTAQPIQPQEPICGVHVPPWYSHK